MGTMRAGMLAGAFAVLTACSGGSGGGGGGGGAGSGDPISRNGLAVDPYIQGATFQELTPARVLVQESSRSGPDGAFAFPQPLTAGNLVVLKAPGIHNGAPYALGLQRTVEQSTGPLVVSPLTTLVASGRYTKDQAAMLVNDALGATSTPEDITSDPMRRMGDGTSLATCSLLAGNLAVSVALSISHGNIDPAVIDPIVDAVAPKLLAALMRSGASAARASAAAAVAEFVSRATTAADAAAACARIDDALLSRLVSAAANGPVTIIETNGILSPGYNVPTVAGQLRIGIANLASAFATGSTNDALSAVNRFSAALALADLDGSATQNDRDEARFFGALARLAILAQPYSDGVNDGLQDAGDLLDAFALGGTVTERQHVSTMQFLVCRDVQELGYTHKECDLHPLPAGAPTSSAVLEFVDQQVGASLRDAIGLLDLVTSGFAARVAVRGPAVEVDHTDALFAKAAAQAALAALEMRQAYQLDVDLARLQGDLAPRDQDGKPLYQARDFLRDHPGFLTLVEAASLPESRADALAGIGTLRLALSALAAETDDQSDDLIRLADASCGWNPDAGSYQCRTIYNASERLAEVQWWLSDIEGALGATGSHRLAMNTADPSDDITVSADALFGGVDLRAKLPSTFEAGALGDRPGLFPDPSFGGVLVASPYDLNADADGDGAPDVFGGYTYFFPGLLAGRTLEGEGLVWGSYQMSSIDDSFVLARWEWDGASYQTVTYPGHYTLDRNVLTMAFDGAGPSGVSSITTTASWIQNGTFSSEDVYRDAEGGVLLQSSERWYYW